LVEKAKESTEKSKLLKKNCDEISFAKENYKRKNNYLYIYIRETC
jgi:hypothetical protein